MRMADEVRSVNSDREYYLHFKIFSKELIRQLIQTYGKDKLIKMIEEN